MNKVSEMKRAVRSYLLAQKELSEANKIGSVARTQAIAKCGMTRAKAWDAIMEVEISLGRLERK